MSNTINTNTMELVNTVRHAEEIIYPDGFPMEQHVRFTQPVTPDEAFKGFIVAVNKEVVKISKEICENAMEGELQTMCCISKVELRNAVISVFESEGYQVSGGMYPDIFYVKMMNEYTTN